MQVGTRSLHISLNMRLLTILSVAMAFFMTGCADSPFYGLNVVTLEGDYENVTVTNDDNNYSFNFGRSRPGSLAGHLDFFDQLPRSISVACEKATGEKLSISKRLPENFGEIIKERSSIYVVLDGNDWHLGYEVEDGFWEFLEIIGESKERREKRRINKDLLESAGSGDIQNAKALIERGADVNHRLIGSQMRPLGASFKSSLEMTDFILKMGAVPGIEVMWASRDGDLDRLKLLARHNADLDFYEESSSHSPLIAAIDNGHFGIVRFLVEHGADVNKPIHNNITPIYSAALSSKREIAEYLLGQGANPHTTLSGTAIGPLEIALEGQDQAMIELLKRAHKSNPAQPPP